MEELFSKPWLERTDVLYYLCCGCFKCKGKKYQLLAVPVDQDYPPAHTDSSSLSDEVSLVDQQEHSPDTDTNVITMHSLTTEL